MGDGRHRLLAYGHGGLDDRDGTRQIGRNIGKARFSRGDRLRRMLYARGCGAIESTGVAGSSLHIDHVAVSVQRSAGLKRADSPRNTMHHADHLPRSDPLYGYLCHDILPQLQADGAAPDFGVLRLRGSNHVYLYEDRHSGIRLVCKFFGGVANRSAEAGFRRMEAEYRNLRYLRSIGFVGFPHYVARPLGRNPGLNLVLVEEFCEGRLLADFIVDAIRNGARDLLFQKLTALASFLATLHNRTADDRRVEFDLECAYFDRITAHAVGSRLMGRHEVQALCRSRDRWRARGCMWEDRRVLIHGDVTPSNILFGDGPWVMAIDLESMKRTDRAFDLGRVVGELKHFFMQYANDGWAAEPFIGHFLWEYSCHFPDRGAAFRSITGRIPFYMGLTLLRIARNDWIAAPHRRRLVDEAIKTLA